MENTIKLEITEEMAIRIRQAMCRMATANLEKSFEYKDKGASYLEEFHLKEREFAHSIIEMIDAQMN